MIHLFFLLLFCGRLNAVLYETVSGTLLSARQIEEFRRNNNSQYCTVNVAPCNENEWRRLDGSCNNLKHPSFGKPPTKSIRVLEPRFSPNYEPAKLKSGKEYPLARYLRTQILKTGKASDLQITQLLSYYALFMYIDIASLHDLLNYLLIRTNCCTPGGRDSYECTPVEFSVDDPVHRFSGVRCQNLTRPQSFQYFGCLKNGTRFARTILTTPIFDVNQVYNYLPGAAEHVRLYRDGLLVTEIGSNGKSYPTSTGPEDPIGANNLRFSNPCALNELPKETRCHKYLPNECISSNIVHIYFYLYHNFIAQKLKQLNPCWDDDRLFFTARDINIAVVVQIYYYEMLPAIFGKSNMIKDGVISDSDGYRDVYDENVLPLMTDEYNYVLRYFHTMQEDTAKLYDEDGYFLNTFALVNGTTRMGILDQDNFMSKLTQSSFRQESGAFDHVIDYNLADRGIGGLQHVLDVAAADLLKGRLLGFQPYIKYREFCTKQKWTMNDLRSVMSEERIYRLSQVYESVEDVELIAGIWSEEHYPGSKIPHTAYCLLVDQLKRSVVSDRHWYERKNRPHAFTLDQLKAIRNTTIAGVFCSVGDGVREIQPNAFYTISKRNPITPCSSPKIGKLNIAPWKDETCSNSWT